MLDKVKSFFGKQKQVQMPKEILKDELKEYIQETLTKNSTFLLIIEKKNT